MQTQRAHTIFELIVVVAILAALALVAVPRLQFGVQRKWQAEAVARKIVADLYRTRSLAIANAATNGFGYTLQMLGPDPHTGYQIQKRPAGQVVESFTIDSDVAVSSPGNPLFMFAPLGNLSLGSGTTLTVVGGGKSWTVTVTAGTGLVKCQEN